MRGITGVPLQSYTSPHWGWTNEHPGFWFPLTHPVPLSPAGDQLCLGARWLPAIYRQQVWSHHRLQQPLHQHHGGLPWQRPPLTFRLHIDTQTTHPPHITPPPPPLSASLVTSQLPLKHISSESTSGIRGSVIREAFRVSSVPANRHPCVLFLCLWRGFLQPLICAVQKILSLIGFLRNSKLLIHANIQIQVSSAYRL